jgi:NAD+ synthase (glutamine-hydrolysing)
MRFSAPPITDEKVAALNHYLRVQGLAACVVALSGGLDSAVTLAIVAAAAAAPDSPIARIVPVALPVFDRGATNQEQATARARAVATAFGLQALTIDLSASHGALKAAVDHGLGVRGQDWASGQLVAYARTPALYYITSLLWQQECPAILCGTTNRDEGAYLGYFGKASDGMVDVQLISDLHKSEVRSLALHVGVPDSVLSATPTGDMYDGRSDEQVFGAPYDFVEFFLLHRAHPDPPALETSWDLAARTQFHGWADSLQALHDYNGHKYLGRSPAVHLDVLDAGVPGGWGQR